MRQAPIPWSRQLKDERGKRVIFLAHCLLNENTRYLGGAMAAGAVPEIVAACVKNGIGMVQLPCPEQQVWGGILKRRLLRYYGTHDSGSRRRRLILPVMLRYTRVRYSRLARTVVRQIKDYIESGYQVLGVIGVDASPSCGVNTTLDMRNSFDLLASLTPRSTSRDINAIVQNAAVRGRGIFIEALQRELRRRKIAVSFSAHDLLAELDNRPTKPVDSLLAEKRPFP